MHEVINVFQCHDMPLSAKLTEMLNEHFSHQTERRGCGYTQATRVLAEFINQPRSNNEFEDLKLFEDFNSKPLRDVMQQASLYGLTLTSWRNLDINPAVLEFLKQLNSASEAFTQGLTEQIKWQQQLRSIHQHLKHEESLILVNMIQDIILPYSDSKLVVLPVLGEKPKVGSCPMAEKFFLEIAHERVTRRGRVNVFTHETQPLLLEKLNMGDNHSCISLQPLLLNGVRLPAGSSFSVAYDADTISKTTAALLPGDIMPLSQCDGFWFLRLTTLAISPQNRQRAFTTHFRQQIENDLFSPDITTLSQLEMVAKKQLAGHTHAI